MLHGRVVRPRGQGPMGNGATIVSIDPKLDRAYPEREGPAAGELPGCGRAARVRRDPGRRAAQGDLAGQPDPPHARATCSSRCRQHVASGQAVTSNNAPVVAGNISAGLASAAKTVAATYSFQNGSRVPIGPACAVAEVTPTLCDRLLQLSADPERRDRRSGPDRPARQPGPCLLLRGRELVRLRSEHVGHSEGGGDAVQAGRQRRFAFSSCAGTRPGGTTTSRPSSPT